MAGAKDLRGQVVAVLGATGVLGSHIARALFGRGASLILSGRSEAKLRSLRAEIPDSHTVPGDLRQAGTRRLLEAAAVSAGHLDGVAVSLGEADYRALAALDEDRIREIIEVNLLLPVLAVRALLPPLIRRQAGSIVLVSSEWGLFPAAGEVPYATAKAGLVGFGRSLAAECAPAGIRVNVLAPAAFESPMLDGLSEGDRASLRRAYGGRLLDPAQIADEAVRLLHPDTRDTGLVIRLTRGGASVEETGRVMSAPRSLPGKP